MRVPGGGGEGPAGAGSREVVIALFAHNDDELFLASRLAWDVSRGARVHAAFLTHGSAYGVPSDVRLRESGAALSRVGLAPSDIWPVGRDAGILDLTLAERMKDAWDALTVRVSGLRVSRVYTMAWEGGHPDHDAAHLLGVKLARDSGAAPAIEFAAYSAAGRPWPLFRTMGLLPGAGDTQVRRLRLSEARRALGLVCSFPSQSRSLAGLLPGLFVRYVLLRREVLRRVPARDYRRPPHEGRLLYERRFGISFERFLGDVRPFLSRLDAVGEEAATETSSG